MLEVQLGLRPAGRNGRQVQAIIGNAVFVFPKVQVPGRGKPDNAPEQRRDNDPSTLHCTALGFSHNGKCGPIGTA